MKLETLPGEFVCWYWVVYTDGCECPSYMRHDRQSEYGCSLNEYIDVYVDEVLAELTPWIIENKSNEEIEKYLHIWIDEVNASAARRLNDFVYTIAKLKQLKPE